MEKKDFASVLLKKQIQKEAWRSISRRYPLTANMLLQFQCKLDWEEVSCNPSIHWDVAMLEQFRRSVDWKVFSRSAGNAILTEEVIEKFKDNWDWSELSENDELTLTYDLIDKYIDRWDWKRLINNNNCRDNTRNGRRLFLVMDFLIRYQQYISAEDLEKSILWYGLVEEEEEAIKKELICGKPA